MSKTSDWFIEELNKEREDKPKRQRTPEQKLKRNRRDRERYKLMKGQKPKPKVQNAPEALEGRIKAAAALLKIALEILMN